MMDGSDLGNTVHDIVSNYAALLDGNGLSEWLIAGLDVYDDPNGFTSPQRTKLPRAQSPQKTDAKEPPAGQAPPNTPMEAFSNVDIANWIASLGIIDAFMAHRIHLLCEKTSLEVIYPNRKSTKFSLFVERDQVIFELDGRRQPYRGPDSEFMHSVTNTAAMVLIGTIQHLPWNKA
jgi:hypothetical protein